MMDHAAMAVAEATREMRETGLVFGIEIRGPGDKRDRVVVQHDGVMGFGDTLDGAWEDFLNDWEDSRGRRLIW